jgi:hypothetical protein
VKTFSPDTADRDGTVDVRAKTTRCRKGSSAGRARTASTRGIIAHLGREIRNAAAAKLAPDRGGDIDVGGVAAGGTKTGDASTIGRSVAREPSFNDPAFAMRTESSRNDC